MSNLENAEVIRKQHLNHEAAVKSIGSLYYLAAIILPLGALGVALNEKSTPLERWLFPVLFLLLSAAYFQLGRWVRALNPKAKTPATILAVIGLLGIPLGTLINAYILYLIHSQKGKMVFSDEYKTIIAETPGIKYKTSKLIWFFIGLLILLILIGIFAAAGLNHK